MELNKNNLEDRLTRELEEIRQQREELDKREKTLIADMIEENSENKSLIGSLLEESVKRIFIEGVEMPSALEKDDDGLEKSEDNFEKEDDVPEKKEEGVETQISEEMNGLAEMHTDVSSWLRTRNM